MGLGVICWSKAPDGASCCHCLSLADCSSLSCPSTPSGDGVAGRPLVEDNANSRLCNCPLWARILTNGQGRLSVLAPRQVGPLYMGTRPRTAGTLCSLSLFKTDSNLGMNLKESKLCLACSFLTTSKYISIRIDCDNCIVLPLAGGNQQTADAGVYTLQLGTSSSYSTETCLTSSWAVLQSDKGKGPGRCIGENPVSPRGENDPGHALLSRADGGRRPAEPPAPRPALTLLLSTADSPNVIESL